MTQITQIRLLFAFSLCLLTQILFGQNVDAKISGSTTTGCLPVAIEFYNATSGPYENLLWEFENGSPASSTEENPIVTFNTLGQHRVLLTATGNGQTSYDSVFIKVFDPKPKPAYSFQTNGLTVTFTNESPFTTEYQWDFGDGKFSDSKDPVHTYEKQGVYLVSLIASNSCQSSTEVDVLVLADNHIKPTYTANEQALVYTGEFKPGVNLGYFPPWNDRTLADIAKGRPELGIKGVGVQSIRPGLFDSFIQQFGWDARVENYNHFDKIGLYDNTLIVGFPAEENRDTNFYCADHQSEMFANLYAPIWDNGENGTPINDNNNFAEYIYKLVNLKKDYIQFYEIWNEPGFDFTNVTGYLPQGVDGNWFDNNPDPCDYKLRAPIFHYVRTLRIAFEVIKAVDPDGFVTLASVGYPSFLDAVLRNTDNPDNGVANADFPLKGGAYFDAIGIHTYPHFDGTLRAWNNDIQGFDYFRHTDKAITTIPETKASFQNVLDNYGYDGNTYPQKEWIITEINVPRKAFLDFIGSEEAQINFLIKSYVECVRSDIRQMHVFDMAESHYYDDASTEFQMMGFYQRLYSLFPYDQIVNNGGMAYKTASDQLFKADLDEQKTAEMQLPDSLDGAAFLDKEGYYNYVLWAKTSEDMSEAASGNYSFPAGFNINQLEKREWDNSYSEEISMSGAQNIQLSGTPIFLKDLENRVVVAPTPSFTFEVINTCSPAEVEFFDASTSNTETWEWSFPGGTPSSSTDQNPIVNYNSPGVYDATLTVGNSAGENSLTKTKVVNVVNILPTADFELNIFGTQASTHNFSTGATNYVWDMGDSNIFTDNNPAHSYATPGYFTVTLYAINGCDTAIHSQDIIILPEEITPRPDFYAEKQGGCPGEAIYFFDASTSNSDSWYWVFDGGNPSISEDQNPVVTYAAPGNYAVLLVVGNDAGTDTRYRADFVAIQEAPVASFTIDQDDNNISFINSSENGLTYLWDFGDNSTSNDNNPEHSYSNGGDYNVQLSVFNYCDTSITTQLISVVGPPLANGNFEQNDSCALLINYTDSSLGQVDSIAWFFEEGMPATSNEEAPVVTYQSSGNYNTTLIAYNEHGSDTTEFIVEVNVPDSPVADFDWDSDDSEYIFENKSNDADSFFWDFGDGNTSMLINPVHTYLTSGTYTVTLISSNICGSDTLIQTLDFTSSNQYSLLNQKLIIYPNPTQKDFIIFGEGFSTKTIQLKIQNGLGMVVYEELLPIRDGRLSYNVYPGNLSAGTYYINLQSSTESISQKLVILN